MPEAQGMGMMAAGQAAGEATGEVVRNIFALGLGPIYNKRQIKQQRRLNELSKEMTIFNREQQMQLWRDTNYGPQKEQMKEAGLNPALMYGMGGGGGATAAAAAAGQQSADQYMPSAMGINLALQKAQVDLLEAQTKKTNVEAEKTAGVDTENVKADTGLKILQQVVTKYTGDEAKDVYERVKSPNRGIEAKTYQDELEARQGLAGTIYELWSEGKLKDKAVQEIEGIALSNAKSRAERANILKQGEILEQNLKGAKLDNIIKDLETRLQTETGIDSKSPTWLKMLGRLFVELMGTK